MAGYSARQSTVDGDVIDAADSNDNLTDISRLTPARVTITMPAGEGTSNSSWDSC